MRKRRSRACMERALTRSRPEGLPKQGTLVPRAAPVQNLGYTLGENRVEKPLGTSPICRGCYSFRLEGLQGFPGRTLLSQHAARPYNEGHEAIGFSIGSTQFCTQGDSAKTRY